MSGLLSMLSNLRWNFRMKYRINITACMEKLLNYVINNIIRCSLWARRWVNFSCAIILFFSIETPARIGCAFKLKQCFESVAALTGCLIPYERCHIIVECVCWTVLWRQKSFLLFKFSVCHLIVAVEGGGPKITFVIHFSQPFGSAKHVLMNLRSDESYFH